MSDTEAPLWIGSANLHDHYWLVGNRSGQVFSSAKPGYVSTSDQRFRDWGAGGAQPTRILSDGELTDVLAKQSFAPSIILAAGVGDWGNVPPDDIMAAVAAAGCKLSSSNGDLNGTYDLAGPEWQALREAAQYVATFDAFPGGDQELVWHTRAGQDVTFKQPQGLLEVVRGLSDYLAKWRRALARQETPPDFGSYDLG